MLLKVTSATYCIVMVLLIAALLANAQAQSSENLATDKAEPTVFTVDPNVSAPRPTYSPNPEYSEQARKAGHQGTCLVSLVVGPDGNPHDIKVAQSLGMGLDEKAIDALRQWKFEPAKKDGHPVAVQINVEVTFHRYNGGEIEEMFAERGVLVPAPIYPPFSTTIKSCAASSPSDRTLASRPSITIVDLNFEGVVQLDASELSQIAASLKQRVYTGTLDEVTEEALERTKSAWQDRGYFKVEASAAAKVLTSSPVNERIAFTVHLDEGQQYRLGGITFKNNKAISNSQTLRNLFPIADGDLFNRENIAHGLENLRKAYGEFGYVNFTSVPDTKFGDDDKLIFLDIDVDEGKQFYISSIDVVGENEQQLENVSKDLPIKPGDVYNRRLAEFFLAKRGADTAPESGIQLRLDERAGTAALTFDLRHCPVD